MADSLTGPTHGQMSWLITMVLVFGLAAVGLPFFFGAPDRWEYRIEAPSDLSLTDELDDLGREGWEVVSARRATSGSGYGASYEMILKRHRSAFAFFGPSRRSTMTPTETTPSDLSTSSTDYQVLDRQGGNLFALISSRYERDTTRLRQFGANLCGSQRPCVVKFWTTKPTSALGLPLSPDQQAGLVAEFSRSSSPDQGTVSLLK
jgi:hypothetical protein